MTHQQMHDLLDILIDKSNLPWFNTAEKDSFLTLAQNEFVKEEYSKYESDERTKQNLSAVVRSFKINGPVKAFMLETLPQFMYLVSIAGYFQTSCDKQEKVYTITHDENATNTTLNETAVHPLRQDRNPLVTFSSASLANTTKSFIKPTNLGDLNSAISDPFNKPDDDYPRYVVRADHKGHKYVEIYSNSEAQNLDVEYIATPPAIDAAGTPAGSSVLSAHTHEEIVNIAVRKMLDNIESQRVQSQRAEIQEQYL